MSDQEIEKAIKFVVGSETPLGSLPDEDPAVILAVLMFGLHDLSTKFKERDIEIAELRTFQHRISVAAGLTGEATDGEVLDRVRLLTAAAARRESVAKVRS